MTFPFRLPNFSLSKPMPCPYVPGRIERRIYTQLTDSDDAAALNDALNRVGFRRSQSLAYRPGCVGCSACVSVRVRAHDFQPSRAQKRTQRSNHDLIVRSRPARATDEQYDLLRHYLAARHLGSGMDSMSKHDFVAMVEHSPVDSHIIEYREPADQEGNQRLVGCCLTDIHGDGLSMMYSFYDTNRPHRNGLGTYIILDHILRTVAMQLPYVYLGYWIENSRRMAYKANFRPLEKLSSAGWVGWTDEKRNNECPARSEIQTQFRLVSPPHR